MEPILVDFSAAAEANLAGNAQTNWLGFMETFGSIVYFMSVSNEIFEMILGSVSNILV